jgi:hypothetical protein
LAYATAADLETKLKSKLGRPFTSDETAAADLLLEGASVAIDEATEKAEVADPPKVFKFVALEAASRAASNPGGLASGSETLGVYSYSEKYLNDGSVWLTEVEERMVRRAVHGTLTGSAEAKSLASDPFVLDEEAPDLFGEVWLWEHEGS